MTLYSIGHSLHDQDAFLQLLQIYEITAIADVRSRPSSVRAPHFSQHSMTRWLHEANIAYVYLGKELGGIPDGDHFYDPRGHVRYDLLANESSFRDGISRLVAGAKKFTIAMMCSEGDPLCCHRHNLVAPALRSSGIEVVHILKDGSSMPFPQYGDLFETVLSVSPKAMRQIGS